jgi:hypothetical protein
VLVVFGVWSTASSREAAPAAESLLFTKLTTLLSVRGIDPISERSMATLRTVPAADVATMLNFASFASPVTLS